MREMRTVDEGRAERPEALKLLLQKRRECGSAAFDAALWRATIDWLASRNAASQRPRDSASRDE